MATDYQLISRQNRERYGTEISNYGQFFVSLYTDKTHFIYELLQNAEDAIARRVRQSANAQFSKRVSFHLYNDRLEFRHFGNLFDKADVEGICGLGKGTKPEDLTQIGKFGIGFKSVYAYTSTPEIHSGDEHFQIENFVHPHSVKPLVTKPDETLFVFRFDRPDVAPTGAFEAIARRLKELGLRTLLFLPQIEEIGWVIEGDAGGEYLREIKPMGSARHVKLLGSANGQDEYEEWLVFERILDDHPDSISKVEVAYYLTTERENQKAQIAPYDHATLVVFFPTEKETHLKFLIQGPYRTTPDRAKIPAEDLWNQRVVRETTSLVTESLVLIREMGLLTVGFLETLPLDSNAFPEGSMFRLIFESVRQAIRIESLLPTNYGNFVSANRAKLASSSALRALLTEEQLKTLSKSDRPFAWLTDEITDERTPALRDYLVYQLDVEEVRPESFARQFTEEFVQKQSDAWMIEFYDFLAGQSSLWRDARPIGPLRYKPFIRCENGKHISPFNAQDKPNVYLPPEQETAFPIVRRCVASDKRANKFLKDLGLTLPSVVDEVFQFVLPKYPNATNPSTFRAQSLIQESHAEDLRKILSALDSISSARRKELIDQLKSTAFLFGRNAATGQRALQCPTTLYVYTQDLEEFFKDNNAIWFLDEEWDKNNVQETDSVLEVLGVARFPRHKAFRPNLSWQELHDLRQGRDITYEIALEDYNLEGLEYFLARLKNIDGTNTHRCSLLLWNLLLLFEGDDTKVSGVYRWKRFDDFRALFDSRFLKLLREHMWLIGRDGKLHIPSEVLASELPDDFRKSEWLEAKLKMKPPVLEQLAQEAGIDVGVLEHLRNNPETMALVKQIMAQQTPSLSGSLGVSNVDPQDTTVVTSITNQTPDNGSGSSTQVVDIGTSDGNLSTTKTGNNGDGSKTVEDSSQEMGSKGGRDGATGTGVSLTPDDKTHTKQSDSGATHPKQSRLLTYVAPPGEMAKTSESDSDRAKQNRDTEEIGRQRACEYEQSRGREPHPQSVTHKGYDIESFDPRTGDKRFIEVKASTNEWGEQGVGLTPSEFDAAKRLGEGYWLYVVERADSPDYRIYPICNPACLVSEFMYDYMWRQLAKNEPPTISETTTEAPN
jgi:hypothetical protein